MRETLIPGVVVLLAICLGYALGYHRGARHERRALESRQDVTAGGGPSSPANRGTKHVETLPSPVICANPDYYDYLHYLALGRDGDVKLTAGAGQAIHFSAQGKYRLDLSNGRLELFDLCQMNPYKKETLRRLPNRTNAFRTEAGVFAMRQETPFLPRTPDEEPVIVFPERYVFETDPLAFAQESAKSNLYYMTETRDLEASERIYYRSELRERITIADAKRRGLKLLSKAEQIGTFAATSTNGTIK